MTTYGHETIMPSISGHLPLWRYRGGGSTCLLLFHLLTLPLHSEGSFHLQNAIAHQHYSLTYAGQGAVGLRPPLCFSSSSTLFSTGRSTCLSSKNISRDEKEVGDWLEKASRLRKEVQEMETNIAKGEDRLQRREIPDLTSKSFKQIKNEIMYTSLEDSSWTMSYRFASEPTRKDNKDDSTPLTFYSGKFSIKLRGDGYTDIVDDEGFQNNSGLEIIKFWGWDSELSSEDNLKYLEFSADVLLPTSDSNHGASGKASRFYFNARIDEDPKTGVITFSDGTVTLKRDVEPPAGVWGIFNAGGILAQFQYCGEFLCKAKES